MDAELIMTVKQMQNHDAWLDMRKKGIGGSDAGAIMGYNPWTSPFALWMEKTGQTEPEDISQKPSGTGCRGLVQRRNRAESRTARHDA